MKGRFAFIAVVLIVGLAIYSLPQFLSELPLVAHASEHAQIIIFAGCLLLGMVTALAGTVALVLRLSVSRVLAWSIVVLAFVYAQPGLFPFHFDGVDGNYTPAGEFFRQLTPALFAVAIVGLITSLTATAVARLRLHRAGG